MNNDRIASVFQSATEELFCEELFQVTKTTAHKVRQTELHVYSGVEVFYCYYSLPTATPARLISTFSPYPSTSHAESIMTHAPRLAIIFRLAHKTR